MEYKVDKPLSQFEFWGGAKDRVQQLEFSELDEIGENLYELFSSTPTDTEINDLFWFDFKLACSLIGLEVDENDDIIR